jgi:hypothetical protein
MQDAAYELPRIHESGSSTSENSVTAKFAEFPFRDRMKSSSMESGAWILVVQRAKNRSFLPRFASPVRSSVWDIESFHTVSLRSA